MFGEPSKHSRVGMGAVLAKRDGDAWVFVSVANSLPSPPPGCLWACVGGKNLMKTIGG